MSFTVRLKNEVLFHNDVVIERPIYMSEEEFRAHINDAEQSLGGSYNFLQFIVKLEDMGFNIIETVSDFVTKEDQARARVIQISEVKGDV